MEETYTDKTVMFTDVAGSMQLYEQMGDKFAKALISETLTQLSEIAASQKGKIIKTIGDEIMCSFPAANNAMLAAKQMHELLADKTLPAYDHNLSIRVGAHHGPIIDSDGDIFGDTVNVSARIASLSRAGKTMITGYTYEQLSPSLQENCRHIMKTRVSGKQHPIEIYDVVWEHNDELTSVTENSDSHLNPEILSLEYADTIITLSENHLKSVSIGRGNNCDLVILSSQASRHHCQLTYNLGKFIFSDNSTNGSFILQNKTEMFLHQEKTTLQRSGYISLGIQAADGKEFLISFSIDLPDD